MTWSTRGWSCEASSTPSTDTRGAVTRRPAARRRSETCSIVTRREATPSTSGMDPDSAHPHLVEERRPLRVMGDVADALGDEDHRAVRGGRDGGREGDEATV